MFCVFVWMTTMGFLPYWQCKQNKTRKKKYLHTTLTIFLQKKKKKIIFFSPSAIGLNNQIWKEKIEVIIYSFPWSLKSCFLSAVLTTFRNTSLIFHIPCLTVISPGILHYPCHCTKLMQHSVSYNEAWLLEVLFGTNNTPCNESVQLSHQVP